MTLITTLYWTKWHICQGERPAVMSGNVQVPHGDEGFVCYWIEKSNVDQ